jgi:tRNA uridine 5-carboxymethylaminomethyl modification enzyme
MAMEGEARIRKTETALRERMFNPTAENRALFDETLETSLDSPTSAYKLLQRKDLTVNRLMAVIPEAFEGLSSEEKSFLESRVRYEGYIRRERDRLERLKPFEARPIPADFRYAGLPGLSVEVVEKCMRRRPRTVGEAARIPGVTPAAIAIISAHVVRSAARPAGLP